MTGVIFAILWVTLGIVGAIVITAIQLSNELPDGRRATKKFVEKISRIEDANRIAGGCALPNCNGVVFATRVVKNDVPNGIRYEAIPVYTCRSLLINDEEVVRVHKIYHNFKDKYFLEFTSAREMKEIVEIVDAAYNWSEHVYSDYIHKTFVANRKSFYTEVK